MAVSSLGAGSGLDLNGILTSLMQVEQQPLTALQNKEASYQARISALGNLKGTLSSLQTAAQALVPSITQTAAQKFASYSASVANTAVASASASAGAVSGSYSLEVTTLAQTQRLTGTAGLSSIATGGTLSIDLGALTTSGAPPTSTYTANSSRQLQITITGGETIEAVRDAINAAATDGRVSATVINGTAGKQLVLTSGSSGTANVMKLSGIAELSFDPAPDPNAVNPVPDSLSQDAANGGLAASDAHFKVGGIAATSSSNSVTGVLDGVTLNLSQTNVGTPTTVTVSRDTTSALTLALNTFVKAYNDSAKSLQSLGFYDASTKQSGPLQGDSTLRSAKSQISSLLRTRAGGDSHYQTLTDIGVSLQKDGTLKLDTTKLNSAISADYAGVTALVAKVGKAIDVGMEAQVGSSGALAGATDSANRMIKNLGKQQTVLSNRLTQIEANYRKQFTALDTMVASMKQTSTYLTQQLANLPGFTTLSSSKG